MTKLTKNQKAFLHDRKRKRIMHYKALDRKVLLVAIEGYALDWGCYAGAVKGNSHSEEMKEVASHGSKVSERLARLIFNYEPFSLLQYRG